MIETSPTTGLLLNILVGTAILIAGNRMLWLFLGGMAFIYVYNFALGIPLPPQNALTMATFAGVFGVLLGLFVQKASLRFIGFLAGGAIIVGLMEFVAGQANADLGNSYFFLFVVGGALGFFLMRYMVDWVVIILSSFVGAIMITRALPIDESFKLIIMFGLVIVGMVAQITTLRRQG